MLSSMSAKGNCYDNAAMESFFGRFKVSTVRDEVYPGESSLRSVVFEYVEPFYNMYRKHSSLEQKSPVEFEEKISPPMGGIGRDVSFTSN
jgi:transposase InsO family protein